MKNPQTALHLDDSASATVLYMAFDLGKKHWYVAICGGDLEDVLERRIFARDFKRLTELIEAAVDRFGIESLKCIYSMYEAGFDGFWLHNALEQSGKFKNFVVDPASIEVSRRGRRKKTDKIDAKYNLRKLVQYLSGDPDTFSVCAVPSRDDEDDRRLERELQTLNVEATRQTNRIKGLLKTHGIVEGVKCLETLDELECLDDSRLLRHEKRELRRAKARLDLIRQQMEEVERDRSERLEQADEKAQKVHKLSRLMGIGERSAFGLVVEAFGWRTFANRRELSSFAGYDPSPYDTGESTGRCQGISKCGNRWIRAQMHLIVINWLRWQPESELSQWYYRKYGHLKAADKRKGRVALARKLLVRLWRFVEFDEVPHGAVLKEG